MTSSLLGAQGSAKSTDGSYWERGQWLQVLQPSRRYTHPRSRVVMQCVTALETTHSPQYICVHAGMVFQPSMKSHSPQYMCVARNGQGENMQARNSLHALALVSWFTFNVCFVQNMCIFCITLFFLSRKQPNHKHQTRFFGIPMAPEHVITHSRPVHPNQPPSQVNQPFKPFMCKYQYVTVL